MAKIIEFDGVQHEFPDDFTDADISAALSAETTAPTPQASAPAQAVAPAPEAADPKAAITQGLMMGALPIASTAQTAQPVTDAILEAPGEIAGQYAGTIAGAKVGAQIGGRVGRLPGAVIGTLVGGLAGGLGGAYGSVGDEFLGEETKNVVGKVTDEQFGDKLQRAFTNELVALGAGAALKAGERALSRSAKFNQFVDGLIEKAQNLPTVVRDELLPKLNRAKNAEQIVDKAFNNPITGDQYIINARDAAKRVSGGVELPVPYETGGKLMSRQALDIADQGPENALADYMEAFAAKTRLQADKVIKGGYKPADTAGLVKNSLQTYDRMLSEPIRAAEKGMQKYASVIVGDNTFKPALKNLLDPVQNVRAQGVDSDSLRKLDKVVNSLKPNATLADIAKFEADLKAVKDPNIKDLLPVDGLIGDLRKGLQTQLATKLSNLSDVGEFARKRAAIEAYGAVAAAKKGKAEALNANKFFDQIGVSDAVQRDLKLTDDAVINKVFESYENFAGFKKMVSALPEGDKVLTSVQDAFRYKIRSALTEDGEGIVGGADKLLRKGGGLSAVPQDRLIAEAAGDDVLKFLEDVSVLGKALGRSGVSGNQGVRVGVKSAIPGLNLGAAMSTADAQRLLARVDEKLSLGATNKLLQAMTDPAKKDTFYRLATTPLVSPQAYPTYVAAMAALGAATDVSREEFEHNARALDAMVKAQ